MTLPPPAIETAELDWNAQGGPVSRRHGDVYFSVEDGLAETRYVFVAANGLAERFARLTTPDSHLVVAETGFGTGLNFLATWACWRQNAPAMGGVMHYVTFERFPLTRDDLAKALAAWPELQELSEILLAQYPAAIRGTHRLVFDGGRVRLTLYLGDALEGLKKLRFTADAWFLDGFAPARNPDLWEDELLTRIAEHSVTGTTFSTFTAVGYVRRGLTERGFQVEKVPGFGQKRDMLRGICKVDRERPKTRVSDLVLIGAGMAGSLLAANLASRGIRVSVVDAAPSPASGASGNAQGALYVKLGIDYNAQTRLALSGLLHSQRTFGHPYFGCAGEHRFWHPCGLLQLASSDAEQQRQKRFIERNHYPVNVLKPLSAIDATQHAGVDLTYPALWFPGSGWVSPATLCTESLGHQLIDFHGNAQVERLCRQEDSRWQLTLADGSYRQADAVVLCAGAGLSGLIPETHGTLPLKPIRGQITALPAAKVQAPRCVICADGYVNPSDGHQVLIGATFDLHDCNPEVAESSRQENLQRIGSWLPALHPNLMTLADESLDRVAFRSTTTDYQPLAGPIPRLRASPESPLIDDGLYCLGGLGSKGLALAPLLAEWLADRLCGQPECLESDLTDRVLPERFARRTKA